MAILVLALTIVLIYGEQMAITKEEIERLKRTVDWEVAEYEENIFKGWTVTELNSLFVSPVSEDKIDVPFITAGSSLPSSISWVASNCDHSIFQQGSCNSAHAVATAGMLSDRCCLCGRDHGWLSVQELVSCDKLNKGCSGGWSIWSLDYVASAKGLVHEKCFPYTAKNSACIQKCIDGSDWTKSHVCNCEGGYVRCRDVEGIKNCLQTGPATMSLGVCDIFNYKSGIYTCTCAGKYIGVHTVMAMGYSMDPVCHFAAKNSWGPEWGDRGYFKIACNTCDIGKMFLNGNTACLKVQV